MHAFDEGGQRHSDSGADGQAGNSATGVLEHHGEDRPGGTGKVPLGISIVGAPSTNPEVPITDTVTDISFDQILLDQTENNNLAVYVEQARRIRFTGVSFYKPASSGILRSCDDVEFNDCVVDSPRGSGQFCLLVADLADKDCKNIRVRGGSYLNAKSHAIVMGTTNTATVDRWEVSSALIKGQVVSSPTPIGLYVQNATNGTAIGNTITGCLYDGIAEASPSTNNVYISNNLVGNGSGGVSGLQPGSQSIRNTVTSGQPTADSGGFRQTIDGFAAQAVAANITTPQEVYRFNIPTSVPIVGARFRAIRSGSVTGVVVTMTANAAAGSLTATVYKNTGASGSVVSPTSLGLSATINSAVPSARQRAAATQAAGVSLFNFGDELYVMVTTTSTWVPADIRCAIEIED